jgi:hypothetical protein
VSDNFNPGFHWSGKNGELRQDWRVLTGISSWEGDPLTDTDPETGLERPAMRITCNKLEDPDEVLLDHYDPDIPLTLIIRMGRQEVEHRARIIGRTPLVLIMWKDDSNQ